VYKKIVSKSFCKKSTKNPKLIFFSFLDFFGHEFLGVSRWGELKNTTKKKHPENLAPAFFWPLTYLTYPRGSPVFFLGGPLRWESTPGEGLQGKQRRG
jgi:hypothetical protein